MTTTDEESKENSGGGHQHHNIVPKLSSHIVAPYATTHHSRSQNKKSSKSNHNNDGHSGHNSVRRSSSTPNTPYNNVHSSHHQSKSYATSSGHKESSNKSNNDNNLIVPQSHDHQVLQTSSSTSHLSSATVVPTRVHHHYHHYDQPTSISYSSGSIGHSGQSTKGQQSATTDLPSELKSGLLLKYKKRFFKSNWRESKVSLYSNATIVSRYVKSDNWSNQIGYQIGGFGGQGCSNGVSGADGDKETKIQMTNQTTLIIFGRQLKDVPKKPILPSGYRMEQLLAIGLIHSTTQKSIDMGHERMTILFHWFLSPTIHELFDWIVAINNSIPNNKQIITNDELTMSLVMGEATHFNNLMMVHDMIEAQQHQEGHAHHYGAHLNEHDGHHSLSELLSHHHGPLGGHPLNHPGMGMTIDSATFALYDQYYGDATTMDIVANADAGTAGAGTFDCGGDFDDCSAFAAADAFAIF